MSMRWCCATATPTTTAPTAWKNASTSSRTNFNVTALLNTSGQVVGFRKGVGS